MFVQSNQKALPMQKPHRNGVSAFQDKAQQRKNLGISDGVSGNGGTCTITAIFFGNNSISGHRLDYGGLH